MEDKVDSSVSVLNSRKKNTICSTVLVEAGQAFWAHLLTGGREGTNKLNFHFYCYLNLLKWMLAFIFN
jgi:hypothetical protein